MAGDVLRSSPFFGLGLGSDDQMSQSAMRAFMVGKLLGIQAPPMAPDLGRLIGNIFWEFWIVFGFLGGVIMLWAIAGFLKSLRIPVAGVIIVAIAAETFWQGVGGPNTPTAWFTVFIVAAICQLRWQKV
jgi:hypothetical protein